VHHRTDEGRTLVMLNMIDAGIHFARQDASGSKLMQINSMHSR
jgi:hypothetical protein